jgi:hypothetical protein
MTTSEADAISGHAPPTAYKAYRIRPRVQRRLSGLMILQLFLEME